MSKQFLKDLLVATCEKDVAEAYRSLLKKKVKGATVSSPHNTDGLLEAFPNIRTLLEFKYTSELKSKHGQCSILIQALYYLKKFEDAGEVLPSTLFVGDQTECFALKTNSVVKYLNSSINWELAPSSAHKHNDELLRAMVEDVDILPFVYDVDERFDIHAVIDNIRAFSENVVRRVRVTSKNIGAIFDYFDTNVMAVNKKLSANARANLFVQLIINPGDNYLHPAQEGVLVTRGFGNVRVKKDLYLSFFSHFEGAEYSPEEKELFTGYVDRLVEDAIRRWKGEFFTPKLFASEAHDYIAKAFGENWRDEYVVWDCCAGTFNLTRDYRFKELYSSTYEKSDLDTAAQMGYNPEATTFQYDFLNDGIDELGFDDKMPEALADALESGRKVLFFINPPFATAGNKNNRLTGTDNKEGVSKTKIGDLMTEEKWGGAAQNLYAQFLYRILQYKKLNKNVKVAFYAPPLFLSGASYKTFRERFLKEFGFVNGFLFEAKHFSDVAKGWGVSFTVFDGKPNNKKYVLDVLDVDVDVFEIVKRGKKEIYNTDGVVSGNEWLRQIKGSDKKYPALCMKSCLSVGDRVKDVSKEYLATLVCDSNNVMKNGESVFILSGPPGSNLGNNEITAANFDRSIALYAARKLIVSNWIDQKDEYLAPNMDSPEWGQFVCDCLVYALFSNSAQQSSFRQVECAGKTWDIKNELFWMSNKEMMKLANKHHYDALHSDAKTQGERFVSKLLADGWYDRLSPDARLVLDLATELVKDSMVQRKQYSAQEPDYGLDCYDAGYAQLKQVWNVYFKERHQAIRDALSKLEARLCEIVYRLGFLKRG